MLFHRLSILLERRYVAWQVVLGMLVIQTGLLLYSASINSPTLNEPAHLVAGLSHLKCARFDSYRVNPPLVRMVAAMPVAAIGYEDWSKLDEDPGARGEFTMGKNFVEANGVKSSFLLMVARWSCLPFCWCGGIICYMWGRDLYGQLSGLLACLLWCFSPDILAHASLITPDAHGAALGFAACYAFWRWLKQPTWLQAALTGFVLGLAELAKTTLILFYPIWPIMWLIYRGCTRKPMQVRDWGRESGLLLIIMTIGLYVLNLGYGFEGTFTPLKDFYFTSALLTGTTNESSNKIPYSQSTSSTLSSQSSIDGHNRFVGSILGSMPVPLPRNYLLGIDIQQGDFENFSRPSYLRGIWQEHGWWYYYIYAALIKVPIGMWIIGVLAVLTNLLQWKPQIAWRDQFVLLFPAIIIFAVVSFKTGFNEHFRYVLPAFPFIFVFLGSTARFLMTPQACMDGLATGWRWTERYLRTSLSVLLPILTSWIVISSLWIYPHSLSYFNEFIGGPINGYKHILGSNADWGQGLYWLDKTLNSHPEWGPIAIAYYGPITPDSLGSRVIAIDWNRTPSPLAGFSHVAISTNILTGDLSRFPWFSGPPGIIEDFQRFFRDQEPVDRPDNSILIFKAEPYTRLYGKNSPPLEIVSRATDKAPQATPVSGLPSLGDLGDGEVLSVSGLLHVLQLHRLGPTGITKISSGQEVMQIVTDERKAKAIFGVSPFVRTRHGLRYRLQGAQVDDPLRIAGESHRDQCLSTFAGLDLPVDYPIKLDSETCCIKDLLTESIANFSFDQREITWTALAYAHYIPPEKQWVDRFGRTTTFSDLQRHIMKQGYVKQSCGGLHILQAIAAIVEADCRYGILDGQTRIEARNFLDKAVASAVKNQHTDGSWDSQWYQPFTATSEVPDSEAFQMRIVVTGHMLELFHNTRWRPSPQVLISSTKWLLRILTDPEFSKKKISICPLTHALRAVQLSYADRSLSKELVESFTNDKLLHSIKGDRR
jgi:hypothetical protein